MSLSHLDEPGRYSFTRPYIVSFAILFIIGTFSYSFFAYTADMSQYWVLRNVALFYTIGMMFAIGLVGALATNRPALTASMFFCYIFYFISPREQVMSSWDSVLVADQQIITNALFLVLVFGLSILLVNAMYHVRGGAYQKQLPALRKNFTITAVLSGCLLSGLIFVVYLGEDIVSSRAGGGMVISSLREGPMQAVIFNFVFPFLYIYPLLVLINYYGRQKRFICSLAVLALLVGVLLNNPIIHARFYVGTLIVGTIMLIVGPHRAGSVLSVLIFGTLISPTLNVFRQAWARDDLGLQVLGLTGLRSLDFDAFSMICYGLIYHAKKGILFGANVVSSVLFFVPRSMWPGKAEPTGNFLYESVMLEFRGNTDLRYASNLSAPIPIEGFLAFGWLGLVALSLAFGAAVRWLDGAPRLNGVRERSLSIRVMYLAYAPVLLLFLARGALLPTFAYTVGLFAAIFVAVRLLRAPDRAVPQR